MQNRRQVASTVGPMLSLLAMKWGTGRRGPSALVAARITSPQPFEEKKKASSNGCHVCWKFRQKTPKQAAFAAGRNKSLRELCGVPTDQRKDIFFPGRQSVRRCAGHFAPADSSPESHLSTLPVFILHYAKHVGEPAVPLAKGKLSAAA